MPPRALVLGGAGTLHALKLAVELRACLLQASTSEVYGDLEVHPQPESYWGHVNPIGVRSCHDEGKRCAESLAMDFDDPVEQFLRFMRQPTESGPLNLGKPDLARKRAVLGFEARVH